MLLVMTVTCLLGTILRRRAVAIGLSTVFVVASYIFNLIGSAASGAIADLMEQLSFLQLLRRAKKLCLVPSTRPAPSP